MDCVFCKIANKDISAKIIYEDKNILAFPDINPITPTHILVIPKKHISSINDLGENDKELMGELFLAAQKIAKDKNVEKTGYRLIFNVGKDAGQSISHIHLHLLGGKKLLWE